MYCSNWYYFLCRIYVNQLRKGWGQLLMSWVRHWDQTERTRHSPLPPSYSLVLPVHLHVPGALATGVYLWSPWLRKLWCHLLWKEICELSDGQYLGWAHTGYAHTHTHMRTHAYTVEPLNKDTLGAELLSSFRRLSLGGRFEPICNL